MQRSPCGCFASLLKPQMPFLLAFTIIRLEQLQQVLIWKHFIRKPCRILLSTISCSLAVGKALFQQQDTYQLPSAHPAELLRSYEKNSWTSQWFKLSLYLLAFWCLRHIYKLIFQLPFSFYIKKFFST